MASYQARQRDPLLDQSTQALLEKRGRELLGLALIVVALAFAAMLGSYSPDDPGWMVATDEPAKNLLGRFGAAVSSTLVILIGRGAWTVPLILFAWGMRFALHRGGERALARVVFAVIAVALASAYGSTLAAPAGWPHAFGLGGLFGDTVAGALVGVIPGSLGFGLKLVSMLAFLGLIAMMLYVTGFDRAELRTIRQFLLTGSILAYSWAMTAMGKGGSAALSGAMKGARGLQDRAAAARTARAEVRAGEWEPPVMASAPAAPVPARAMVRRADPAPAAASYAPEPLAAAPAWNAPSTLRAEPRRFDAPSDLPKEKLGFLARMRRVVEPEPELIEPPLSGAAMEAVLPPEDRIKARISDVIRSRARGVGPALITSGMTPVQAAVAARRMEPPVMRPRGPVPLMADTRPGTLPPGAALPQAAEAAPQPRAIPAPPPLQPADNMFTAEDEAWDDTDTGWQADEDAEADFDPTPLAAPRVPLAADRRPVVQAPVKKAVQPSTRALAEAQPRLRFDDPAPAYELPPLSLLA
ncbi:MAG: DNA translocase FtsK 4TM domain-containing protein, partial [Fuscovulum sp.]|nr:DNA translocase FtsK 4TM domain-containing protein [Fuscovulum sp.]